MAATTQVREIRIQIDTKGNQELKALASQMGLLNKNVGTLSGSFAFLRSVAGISVLGFGIREVMEISDSMQNLTNRLELFSGSAGDARKRLGDLLTTANQTKTSIESLATIYVRLAQSTKETGISTATLLDVTKGLQQTFRLSGATTTEATNAAIQLSQGLASGQLRGQELRSVLEQNVIFGDILTKSLGKTRGALFKLAEQGRITSSEVLTAILKNVQDLDKRAEKLTATFEQSLTVALNNLKVAIGDINKELGLSSGFAKALDFVAANLKSIAVLILGLAATVIPALVASLKPVALAIAAALGTVGALVVGAGIAIGLLIVNFDTLAAKIDKTMKPLKILFNEAIVAVYSFEKALLGNVRAADKYLAKEKAIADAAKSRLALLEGETRTLLVDRKRLDDQEISSEKRKREAQLEEIKRLEKLNKLDNLDKKQVLLERLNNQYLDGAVSIESYFKQLDKLERQDNLKLFKEGKKDLGQFNEQVEKLDKIDLNRSLNNSVITVQAFNEAIKQNELEKLTGQLQAGKISLLEYDQAFLKLSDSFLSTSVFRTGAESYIKSIGTIAEQTSALIENTFKSLEDSFVAFTKTGQFNFREFAQAVLDDLNRIIIRSLIIQPLAKGLLNYAGAGAADSYNAVQTSPSQKAFASGGVINGPASFMYGGGKLGLMGEAGPEAILPLSKTSDGSLGVSATPSNVIVNISNQTGGEVSQRESTGASGEKIIDIMITNKVKGAIASGQLDKSFQAAYGLRRKGS